MRLELACVSLLLICCRCCLYLSVSEAEVGVARVCVSVLMACGSSDSVGAKVAKNGSRVALGVSMARGADGEMAAGEGSCLARLRWRSSLAAF